MLGKVDDDCLESLAVSTAVFTGVAAAETVLLAEPFSPLSESQWISCLSSWLRHQLDRIEPEMLCQTLNGRHGGSEWV